MNIQDIRNAVESALSAYEGEVLHDNDSYGGYIGESTIVVGVDNNGRYWAVDNGEEIDGLTYDELMQFCIEELSETEVIRP